MDRFTKAMGPEDEDVVNLKAGIDGLVFGNWSDDEILAGVAEMVKTSREEMAEVFAAVKAGKDDKK